MEKKEVFKEASIQAQMEQARMIFKEPYYVNSGTKQFEVRPITCRNSARFGYYAVRQVLIEEPTQPNLIAAAKTNLKLQCKAISIALLSDSRWIGLIGVFKRLFVFPFHWRMLYNSLDNADLNALFIAAVEKLGNGFFFQNLTLTQQMNPMTKKKTKEEVEAELSQAEQKSD